MFLRLILGHFLIISVASNSWGQDDVLVFNDVINEDPELDANYFRGPFLVYDCEEAHYVCTGQSEFNFCEKKRQDRLKDIYADHLGCVPIKKYSDATTCHKKQLELMTGFWSMLHCTHPEKRKRPYWP